MSKALHISLALDNDAFQTEEGTINTFQLQLIFQKIIRHIENANGYADVFDVNGNAVGYYSVTEED